MPQRIFVLTQNGYPKNHFCILCAGKAEGITLRVCVLRPAHEQPLPAPKRTAPHDAKGVSNNLFSHPKRLPKESLWHGDGAQKLTFS